MPRSYEWTTPRGDVVALGEQTLEALAEVARVFPGARAVWWRLPGERWRRV